MASERAERLRAPPFIDPPGYARHRSEATLLYQLVERHYPELVATSKSFGSMPIRRSRTQPPTRNAWKPASFSW
jgi:hypothetical protein